MKKKATRPKTAKPPVEVKPLGWEKVINERYDPAVPIGDIQPSPDNVNQSDLGAISQSIAANGFYGACVVQQSTGYILAGSHRYRAAIGEGATTVPVIFVSCDDLAAKKIMLADNKSTRLGIDDPQALAELLASIQSEQGDFTGTLYDQEDYDRLLSDLANGYVSGLPRDEIKSQQFETPNATVTGQESDEPKPLKVSLADRFGVPPFSVLDARQGYWQARKKAWLALGIKSEIGRGDCTPGGGGPNSCRNRAAGQISSYGK